MSSKLTRVRGFGRVLPLALASLPFLLLPMLGAPEQDAPPKKPTVDFNRDVRPILSEKCYKCHGPDAQFVKGNLRLDDPADATRLRGKLYAIRPGAPDESEVMHRIIALDNKVMPPENSGVAPLTDREIEILRTWIEEGAVYQTHWSFLAPKSHPLPEVKLKTWGKNFIDPFVLRRLEDAGMAPEPSSKPDNLLRRASLTLTGLPPTPEEIAAFMADKKPGAYDRAVDRLLASPRYGEHQARYWLDAVRYGDTHGLHLDNERAIFPYRDWVVSAFNKDLPFDDFATWQLAGDMLSKPSIEQLVATGYIRMNPTTNEGGAIEEEFLAKNTFDRVDTFSTVFLGLTMACARCHDHKYDPLSQKDYFRLYAYFNSTADKPLDGNDRVPAPVLRVKTPEQEKQIAGWLRTMDALKAKVTRKQIDSWIASAKVDPVVGSNWELSKTFTSSAFDTAYAQEFGPEPGGVEYKEAWKPAKLEFDKALEGIVGAPNAAVYVRGKLTTSKQRTVSARVSSDDGVRIWLNGALVHDNKALRGITQAVDDVKLPLKAGENEIIFKIVNGGGQDGLRFGIGDASEVRIRATADKLAKNEKNALSEAQALYLELGPDTAEAKTYRKAQGDIAALEATLPFTLIAEELSAPRDAYVLRRGEYNLPTEKVTRATPGAIGALPAGVPNNRLGLASWLTSEKHPLFARVFVNRVWQQHFGTGLVKTAEDFGAQGEWPSHPELLDTLSVRFMKEGWSIKRLHRWIVTSAAFRQSAAISKDKLEKDPENRLISRGPRFRLDAEVLRDQALFVSGLLVEKRGGKGDKPYQPAGLWEAIAFLDSNTARYVQDKGEALYRRSIYLYWKRTSPPPAMLTFDAPMRESCTVRRSRTNTPMQALVTLNDPTYVEAARVFAAKIYHSAKDDKARLQHAYQRALGRAPKPNEETVLLGALDRYRKTYAGKPKEAESVLSVGEMPRDKNVPFADHAAWTLVASTILNLDEFLTQH